MPAYEGRFQAEMLDAVAAVEPDFDFSSAAYAVLFGRSRASVFQHPVWLEAHRRILAPARQARPQIVTLRTRAGDLIAVLPLILREKRGVRLLESFDLGVSDYSAPIVDRTYLPLDHAAALLRERVRAVLPPHDVLRIRPIREEHCALWALFLGGEMEPLDFHAHATEIGPDYAAWRDETPKKALLGRLSRGAKQATKAGGAVLTRLCDTGEIAEAVEAMRGLRAGRFEGDPIQEPAVAAFYAAVATQAGALSGVYSLSVAGAPAGYVYGLHWQGTYHYLLIGCDYEAFGRLSPGLLLYDGIIREIAAAGGGCFDFTIGDEAFKADFGTTATRMFQLSAAATWIGQGALIAHKLGQRWRGL